MGTLGGELAAEVPFTLMNPPLEETVVRAVVVRVVEGVKGSG